MRTDVRVFLIMKKRNKIRWNFFVAAYEETETAGHV